MFYLVLESSIQIWKIPVSLRHFRSKELMKKVWILKISLNICWSDYWCHFYQVPSLKSRYSISCISLLHYLPMHQAISRDQNKISMQFLQDVFHIMNFASGWLKFPFQLFIQRGARGPCALVPVWPTVHDTDQ